MPSIIFSASVGLARWQQPVMRATFGEPGDDAANRMVNEYHPKRKGNSPQPGNTNDPKEVSLSHGRLTTSMYVPGGRSHAPIGCPQEGTMW